MKQNIRRLDHISINTHIISTHSDFIIPAQYLHRDDGYESFTLYHRIIRTEQQPYNIRSGLTSNELQSIYMVQL